MEEYKANSRKSREEKTDKKKIEKVVNGTAKLKKKSEIRKFTDVFMAEDVSSVKDYILQDVLIPAVKKLISDVITNGADMLLFGNTRKSRDRGTASKVSYRSYYESPFDRSEHSSRRNSLDYNDILLQSRGEAEEVLARMEEIIERYQMISVAEYYELCDITAPYTSNKYGWTSVKKAQVVRVKDGYMIKLPTAMPLD